VHLIDNLTGKLIRTFNGHKNKINSIAITPDSEYMVTGSEDSTAILWEVKSGRALEVMQHKYPVKSVGISPKTRHIVTSDGKASKWNMAGMMLFEYGGN